MSERRDRPEVCFGRWGSLPEDRVVRVRSGQAGFFLVNDGITAHEISIEPFEIFPGFLVQSEVLHRIGEKETGFVLVCSQGPEFHPGKWDLAAAMKQASESNHLSSTFGADFRVPVTVKYRDRDNVWYRSSADLIYARSLEGLRFGPTTHELVKETASFREFVGADAPNQDSAVDAYPEDPIQENPCPKDHPAYQVWEGATSEAVEKLYRFQITIAEERPTNPAEERTAVIKLILHRFQIWAERGLCILRTHSDARAYARWLDVYMQASIRTAMNHRCFNQEDSIAELRLNLLRANSHWKASAVDSVRTLGERLIHKKTHGSEINEDAASAAHVDISALPHAERHGSGPSGFRADARKLQDVGLPKNTIRRPEELLTEPLHDLTTNVPPEAADRVNRRGDAALLHGKSAVTFAVSEAYLGIGKRQRQSLISSDKLKTTGEGHHIRVTTASLLSYLPPRP